MRPSLRDGDVVLIDKWSHKYLGMPYHLNDIVICSVGKKRKKCEYTPTLYLIASNIFIQHHAPFVSNLAWGSYDSLVHHRHHLPPPHCSIAAKLLGR